MKVERIFDLLDRYAEEFPDKPDALAGKVRKEWKTYSSRDYIDRSAETAKGFLEHGLRPGDRVATVTRNRPEWNILDMGMAMTGLVHVPLFPTLSVEEYRKLIGHAEPRLLFIGSQKLYEFLYPLKEEFSFLEEVYCIDPIEDAPHWERIPEAGRNATEEKAQELERIKEGIEPDDTATLIYTSGTTGNSKGVLLSHRNLISNAIGAAEVFRLTPSDRYLSILPLCHVGERMANYQTQYSGSSIYYAEGLDTIARDMQELKPEGFGAVPRILERVYERIRSKGAEQKGLKKRIFFWAMDLGHRYKESGNGLFYKMKLNLADKLVFSKWREAMGGQVRAVGVGGAALPSHIERVFWAAGIRLLNMYGLTETSPIITINRQAPPELKLGTVGSPLPEVEVRLAEDGEILCKGPNVMKGYYKDEQGTKDMFDEEGWFHTGDVGKWVDARFLQVTDRKKSIFKLSNGKYVSPGTVEERLRASPYIEQAMVIGEGEKFASALIVPNFEALKGAVNEIPDKKEEVIAHPEVEELFRSVVREINQGLEKDEQIRRHRLVADEWSPDSGELSPTLKLKRKVILERYKELIGSIYRS